jgi:hypothetical protein
MEYKTDQPSHELGAETNFPTVGIRQDEWVRKANDLTLPVILGRTTGSTLATTGSGTVSDKVTSAASLGSVLTFLIFFFLDSVIASTKMSNGCARAMQAFLVLTLGGKLLWGTGVTSGRC